MANVRRLEQRGTEILVHFDDGTKARAFPTTGNNWLVKRPTPPVVTPDPGDGTGANGWELKAVPESLSAKDTEGTTWTYGKTQLTRASNVIKAALQIKEAANKDVIRIVLITALVESVLRMYSNVTHYPETANYPHEADAADSDSVGLFQQRPSMGWGSPKDCMTEDYSTRAFLGKAGISNNGLFDISGWQSMSPGRAAQKVQGSAFPARYDVKVPVANAIMEALMKPVESSGGGGGGGGAWQWPFQYSRYVIQTDPLAQFGYRIHPIYHTRRLHMGLDFGAGGISGLAIPAASDGKVIESGYNGAMGNHVILEHAGGFLTRYFHMTKTPDVSTGSNVTKGQKLGNVGATGAATGPHLHWETFEGGSAVNPRDFMKRRGAPEN